MQVSQDGGTEPVWAPDGRALYYRDRTGSRVHAVPITMGAVPQFGAPVITTGYWHPGVAWSRSYDIRPDGRALLLLPGITTGREIRVVLNFDEVIRRKLAGGSERGQARGLRHEAVSGLRLTTYRWKTPPVQVPARSCD